MSLGVRFALTALCLCEGLHGPALLQGSKVTNRTLCLDVAPNSRRGHDRASHETPSAVDVAIVLWGKLEAAAQRRDRRWRTETEKRVEPLEQQARQWLGQVL
jgi:hypothetical protein